MLARLDQATEPRHLDLPGCCTRSKANSPVIGASRSAPIGRSSFASSRVMQSMLIWSITTSGTGGHTMSMKNPPHPGLSVRHDCIEALGLTITEAAQILGVTRQTLNNLVNG